MNINEKLEELGIEKEQIIIFGVIGLVVLFLLYGLFSSSEEEEVDIMQNIEMPENKSKKEYQTKLEAYARENQEKENNFSLDFDRDLLKNDNLEKTKKQLLEEQIDSMLNSKKPKKAINKTTRRRATNNTYSSIKKNKEQERLRLEQQAKLEQIAYAKSERERLGKFFTEQNNSTPEVNNINNSQDLRTDKNIEIMVNGDQNIKSGTRVSLILTQKAIINGISYDRNTRLYGFASFGNHRLFININNIKNNPVDLKIYDAQDGNLGLYTKINLAGEISTEVLDDTADDIEVNGIKIGSTVKKIFKKKNKEKKILIFNRTKFILN
ncbi:MAG TPA: conjugative transposon protein TraM [Bacteroidia bacterium]|nr:conjugative transposon protein TraM [Bacteroidia bacterium]